eukprot:3711356-Pleurochrysis_carterae.AAC.4
MPNSSTGERNFQALFPPSGSTTIQGHMSMCKLGHRAQRDHDPSQRPSRAAAAIVRHTCACVRGVLYCMRRSGG